MEEEEERDTEDEKGRDNERRGENRENLNL